MVDKSDIEEKSLKNGSREEVEEIYHKLLRLYERLAADRLIVVKQGEALYKIIDELKAESKLATEFKVHVRQDVVESIRNVVVEIKEQLKKIIHNTTSKEINDTVKELKSVTSNSIEVLKKYTEEKEKPDNGWVTYLIMGMGLCAFLGIMYTTITVGRYMPNTYLSSEQIDDYRSGHLWNGLWNRISKKERERIVDLAIGKLPPEEWSIAWLKEKNPKLSGYEIKKKFEEHDGG